MLLFALDYAAGRQMFKTFLRSEYSEENMLFWIACEELKHESVPDVVEEKARSIYDDYISILSPKEVCKLIFQLAVTEGVKSAILAKLQGWKTQE